MKWCRNNYKDKLTVGKSVWVYIICG